VGVRQRVRNELRDQAAPCESKPCANHREVRDRTSDELREERERRCESEQREHEDQRHAVHVMRRARRCQRGNPADAGDDRAYGEQLAPTGPLPEHPIAHEQQHE